MRPKYVQQICKKYIFSLESKYLYGKHISIGSQSNSSIICTYSKVVLFYVIGPHHYLPVRYVNIFHRRRTHPLNWRLPVSIEYLKNKTLTKFRKKGVNLIISLLPSFMTLRKKWNILLRSNIKFFMK